MSDLTLFDIVKKERPELISEDCDGGVEGCPQFYKFLDKYRYRLCHEFEFCSDCWHQKAVISKFKNDKFKNKNKNKRFKK